MSKQSKEAALAEFRSRVSDPKPTLYDDGRGVPEEALETGFIHWLTLINAHGDDGKQYFIEVVPMTGIAEAGVDLWMLEVGSERGGVVEVPGSVHKIASYPFTQADRKTFPVGTLSIERGDREVSVRLPGFEVVCKDDHTWHYDVHDEERKTRLQMVHHGEGFPTWYGKEKPKYLTAWHRLRLQLGRPHRGHAHDRGPRGRPARRGTPGALRRRRHLRGRDRRLGRLDVVPLRRGVRELLRDEVRRGEADVAEPPRGRAVLPDRRLRDRASRVGLPPATRRLRPDPLPDHDGGRGRDARARGRHRREQALGHARRGPGHAPLHAQLRRAAGRLHRPTGKKAGALERRRRRLRAALEALPELSSQASEQLQAFADRVLLFE
ncbi:MAG: hypothetical protein R3E53_21660 [Myxococcota bacterium]